MPHRTLLRHTWQVKEENIFVIIMFFFITQLIVHASIKQHITRAPLTQGADKASQVVVLNEVM